MDSIKDIVDRMINANTTKAVDVNKKAALKKKKMRKMVKRSRRLNRR